MQNQYTNLDTIKFFVHQVHQTEKVLGSGRFEAYDSASVDMFLDSIKTLSDTELFPYIKEMDEKPSFYKDGAITIHPQFEKIFQQAKDLGLVDEIGDAHKILKEKFGDDVIIKKFEKSKGWLSQKLSSSNNQVDQLANILDERSIWQRYGF